MDTKYCLVNIKNYLLYHTATTTFKETFYGSHSHIHAGPMNAALALAFVFLMAKVWEMEKCSVYKIIYSTLTCL